MSCLFALAVAPALLRADPAPPAAALEADPLLARIGGAATVLQWLIREGTSRDYLSQALFAKAVREELLDRPERIAEAIRGGDAEFALALERALMVVGVPEKEARTDVESLASGGRSKYLSAAASNPQMAASLLAWWVGSTPERSRAERAILLGSAPESLVQTAAGAARATAPGKEQPLYARWSESAKIASRAGSYSTAIARYARPDDCWAPAWETVLARLRAEVEADPAYGAELLRRLSAWDGSYRSAVRVLAEALSADGGAEWAGAYFALGSSGKLWGRPRWLWEEIAPGRSPVQAEVFKAAPAVDDRLRAGDDRLADWILWDLGRLAESASLAAREALARSLSEDPEAAALSLRGVWEAGASWEQAWLESPWWRSDPAVAQTTPAELRRKLNAGRLAQDELLGFGAALGRYLKASDASWTGLVEADPELLRRLLQNAYAREPGYAGAWARELAGNDPELLELFAASPVLQGVVRREEVWPWIKNAAEDLASCEAKAEPPRAGTQGEQFRTAFGKWAFADGWPAVGGRLRRETRRTSVLRKLLAARWKAQPESFLSFYGRILPLPAASGLAERGAEELSGTDAPVAILAALDAWNIPAASVLAPVWSRFLSEGGILEDLCRSIAEAGPHSPLHSIAVPAVRELEIRGCALPKGALDPVAGIAVRRELLLASPRPGSDLWKALVATIAYGEGWQPLAGWILSSPERVLAFRSALREAMRADPGIPAALAAAGRLPGDPAIARRLERILEELIEVTLSDRALWEGMLADHTGGIRAVVKWQAAAE